MRFGENFDTGEKLESNVERNHIETEKNDFENNFSNKWLDTKKGDNNETDKREVSESDSEIKKVTCINEDLEGQNHPETNVPYERKIVEVEGKKIEGVFPQFESKYDVKLPEELYKESDFKQFSYCSEKLKEDVQRNPEFAKQFSERQYSQIMDGSPRISGYTWHHTENQGEMKLVDADTHDATRHTGGRSIWGGGAENR